jgi:hypothetical protein
MTKLFSGDYLRNRSTLDIGVLGYIGVLEHKEHSSDVWHIPPGKTCMYTECPMRIVPAFGRIFLKLKYTDITKNTCIRTERLRK